MRLARPFFLLLLASTAPAPARAQLRGVELAALAGADSRESARFGTAVAISATGERALVGSHRGARVFVRTDARWSVELDWTAPGGSDGLDAGSAVALSSSGDLAVIGAPAEQRTGVVHIWRRDDEGWSEEPTWAPHDAEEGDRIGGALALSADGTRLFVGAPRTDGPDGDLDFGAVHAVVRQPDGTWALDSMLRSPDGARRDLFGSAVSASSSGVRVIVGAPFADMPGEEDAGAAYVLALGLEGWAVEAVLHAAVPRRRDLFGSAVAISGDGTRVLVGAPGDDSHGGRDAGSVHAFALSDTAWMPVQSSVVWPREDGPAELRVGAALALSSDGERAVVGASGDPSHALLATFTGEGLVSRSLVLADVTTVGPLPTSAVALSADGRWALVGAPRDSIGGVELSGSARVMALSADDGTGLPEVPAALPQAVHFHDAPATTGVAQALAALPVLAALSAAGVGLLRLLDPGVDTVPRLLGLTFGSVLSLAGWLLLPSLVMAGVGDAMGARGHWGGAVAGSAIAAVASAGVVAAFYAAGRPSGVPDEHVVALDATGATLTAVLVGAGAMVGYWLWDGAAREHAGRATVPIFGAATDGATAGVAGTF